MSLKGVATETLRILNDGYFIAPNGERLLLQPALTQAIEGTRLFAPHQAAALLDSPERGSGHWPNIEVTEETTQAAARRLVILESVSDLVLLNFASARNPGGGFINGAKAQEEDLSRCSGLYPCLLTQPDYYDENRANESVLYTDNIIYSPDVPWFRTRSREAPDVMFLASVITAPAPNASVALQRDPGSSPDIEVTLRRRAGMVLAVAAHHRHRNLLLGAWGCGVFRNTPSQVADAFGVWLASERFAGLFDRVVFAIYDKSPQRATLHAFEHRFSADSQGARPDDGGV